MSNIARFVLIVILLAGYIFIMKGLIALEHLEFDHDRDRYGSGGCFYADGDADDDDCDFDFDFD